VYSRLDETGEIPEPYLQETQHTSLAPSRSNRHKTLHAAFGYLKFLATKIGGGGG
jgi:hypothetical protein